MNKKFKAKWIKALRSGKFKQCAGQLMRKTFDSEGNESREHCCLGVARYLLDNKARFGAAGKLNKKELNAIGINDEQQGNLIELNDDKFWSFKKIANYIQKHL